jgi:hypothetical protein
MNIIKISFGCISLILGGCEANHLAYVQETNLGIDVSVSTQGTGHLVLGYDRDTYSLVPRKDNGEDAMTVTSLGCIYAQGLSEVNYNYFVSTGKAAVNIAKTPDTLAKIKQAINGGGTKCEK